MCLRHQCFSKMAVAVSMFRWLDLLEKEFDKTFVDLDILLGEIDPDQSEITYDGRQKMTQLSSTFAQLVHKAQTIFQGNAKLEAELVSLRHDLVEDRAAKQVLEKEVNNLLLQLHAVQLQLHSNTGMPVDSENIKNKLESDMTRYKNNAMKEARLECQTKQLEKENTGLRNHVFSLQGEVYGARLAAKYLDKELAGRIQQIQLLGRDMRGAEHDQLWNQIEAEIHLHRHKTVIRACRGRRNPNSKTPAPPPPSQPESTSNDEEDAESKARKRRGIGEPRTVVIHKDKSEGLGISITGGKEHGVPIIVSEIHEGLPVDRAGGLYVGDAILAVNGIDLQEAKHSDAVRVLSTVHGEITLEVLYVAPDDSSDDEDTWEEDETQRYSMLGRVEDPANELLNGDVYMTNSKRDPAPPQSTAAQSTSSNNHIHRSPPPSPRSLSSHPGSAQPMNQFPRSTKKYSNPAMIPDSFSTTVDSRGGQSNLPSSRSSSSLSLASTLSPQQTGSLNVGRLEPSIQTPPEGSDASSELFSPST
ncbi:Golgi-associated PDZ and coiled-coil motif-containing protein-like [Acropora millepora]|uniref:Golgi-associated PDZ and coiled-coil motif-containing protein-like n=1 Tax=Acropora millepora TaxID=45264 RepID=UPI001CF16DC8|nr:Golgi-associated PDZ and coiled-coil motif-containing protein-like [Acropora millepora]